MTGLYVHVPFCARKCRYCDFYSLPGREDAIPRYVDAVLSEARSYAGTKFETLYLGGGTPSLIGADGLSRLMSGLRRILDLSGVQEASIEVNPESAAPELLRAAQESGISRVSIGVQSLADDELASAGRIHNAARAVQAVNNAREAGYRNISADVIIGLPGQDWPSLRRSLSSLINLHVDHISAYCLSLEAGTPLAGDPPSDLPSDDDQAGLFENTRTLLTNRGFSHYEISNFARPGFECQHNLNYWRGGEYVGLGPAAASHLGGKRFRNRPDLDAYLRDPAGQVTDVERLNPAGKTAEEAMLRLRLLQEGLDIEELAARYGEENVRQLCARLDSLAREGSLVRDGTRYILPAARVLTANRVLAEVVAG